ncbi:MAG TPA: hypothetical protein VNH11_33485 [Pirellulales bacterium]|nr:hypothetical protein [Pirellulales bacterium]
MFRELGLQKNVDGRLGLAGVSGGRNGGSFKAAESPMFRETGLVSGPRQPNSARGQPSFEKLAFRNGQRSVGRHFVGFNAFPQQAGQRRGSLDGGSVLAAGSQATRAGEVQIGLALGRSVAFDAPCPQQRQHLPFE